MSQMPFQATTTNKEGRQVITGKAPFYMSWMEEEQKYDVDVYLSTANKLEFFG